MPATADPTHNGPSEFNIPSLEYTLSRRKLSIAVFWSLIIFDSLVLPIALYFPLWYDTNLSPNTVFSIVTAAIGGVSIFEYVYRVWKLVKSDSNCRCLGAKRSYLDWFHWCFSFMWIIVIVELVVGTTFTNPPIRLLSMPLTSSLYTFGSICLIIDLARYLHVRLPIRISSLPKQTSLRPAIYPFIEDIVAVDGGGGERYRKRLSKRYDASPVFQHMMGTLSLAWGLGAEATAIITTVLVFTLEKDPAYVIGWSLPWAFTGLWTLATVWYVRRKLAQEQRPTHSV